jgi:hypothetical protein
LESQAGLSHLLRAETKQKTERQKAIANKMSCSTSGARQQLELVFALQHERSVARDNTVNYDNRVLQIDKTKWRCSLAGCKVKVYKHLDGSISLSYGPHIVGRYDASGAPLQQQLRPRAPGQVPAGGRRKQKPKPDISLATKSGHFHLLPTLPAESSPDAIGSHAVLPPVSSAAAHIENGLCLVRFESDQILGTR